MRCKIVKTAYVIQYYEVNQKLKKFQFYIIVSIDFFFFFLVKIAFKPMTSVHDNCSYH